MRLISILIFSVYFIGTLNSQINIEPLLPDIRTSDYLLTLDSNEIFFDIPDIISSKFNSNQVAEFPYSKMYTRKGIGTRMDFFFSRLNFTLPIDTTIFLKGTYLEVKSDQPFYVYGFKTRSNQSLKASKNLSIILTSAYLQETNNTAILEQFSFEEYPDKSTKEYWKRNMINMGYGTSYIYEQNPFLAHKTLAVGFAYIFEALHYIPILGGAFFGKTKQDKIAIPLIGLGSLLFWKTILWGQTGNSYVKFYNDILINSGYMIPSNLKH